MAVTYKDIDQLSQKSSVAGTEKIPVSDTQYLTPAQIATSKQVHLEDESEMPASPDASTLYLIDDDGSGGGSAYTLPIASASTLGGVKVGSGLSINSTTGVLDATVGSANIVHLDDESEMPASPDPDTLYAIDDNGEVLVSTSAQTLTSAQQAQARTNIGAAATSDIPTTVASMTDASNYPKYVLLADEAAYTALATKDSGTLYLIPKTS